MSRLTQILRGKKIKPLTEREAAVKYAVDHAGSGGGGGGDPLVVNLTNLNMDDETMIGTATFDKTVAEIAAAHEKDREVYAVLDTSEEKDGHMERSVYRIPLTAVSYIDGTPRGASFSMTQMVSENANMVYSGMLVADNPTGTITVKALN